MKFIVKFVEPAGSVKFHEICRTPMRPDSPPRPTRALSSVPHTRRDPLALTRSKGTGRDRRANQVTTTTPADDAKKAGNNEGHPINLQ